MTLKRHEKMALDFLSKGSDRIRVVENDETLAAAMVYMELGKRGLVHIDNEDGMLVTISDAGMEALFTAVADGASSVMIDPFFVALKNEES